MEDIYSFKPKPFNSLINLDDSNDEDEDLEKTSSVDIFSRNNKKRTRKPSKYKLTALTPSNSTSSTTSTKNNLLPLRDIQILLDSDDEIDEKKKNTIVILDDDNMNNEENITIESNAKKAVEALFEKTMSSIKPVKQNSVIINLVANSDQEIKKYSELLSRHRQKKIKSNFEDIAIDDYSSSTHSVDVLPIIVLPTVRKASERILSNNTLDNFQSLTSPSPALTSQLSTSSTFSQSQSLSQSQSIAPPINQIKLNTRLNGKHRGNWKMSKSDPFTKLKDALRSKYGLNLTNSQIKLSSCDGPLSDNDTPEDADLEDDDLIDVNIKISDSEITEAIAHFESTLKNRTTSNPTLTPSNSIPSNTTVPNSSTTSTTTTTNNINNNTINNSTTTTVPTSNILQVRILIPDTISSSTEDLDISVRVNKQQSLSEIHHSISTYFKTNDITYSIYDTINDTILPIELQLDETTTIEKIISQLPTSQELTLLTQPGISKSLELTVVCHLNKNNNESSNNISGRGRGSRKNVVNTIDNNIASIDPQIITLIVKPSQTCRKMMEKITTHFNITISSCIFSFNGKTIKQNDTFQQLGIINGSQTIMRLK